MFIIGLGLGGLTVALFTAVLGSLLVQWWLPPRLAAAMLVLAVFAALFHEVGLAELPLPQNGRQVPEQIFRRGPLMGALQFGFEMGTGLRTFMTSALPHVLAVGVFLLAGPLEAFAAGLGFGAGRALVPLGRWLTDDSWSDLFARHVTSTRVLLAGTVVLSVGGIVAVG